MVVGWSVTRTLSPLKCVRHTRSLIAMDEPQGGCTINIISGGKPSSTPSLDACIRDYLTADPSSGTHRDVSEERKVQTGTMFLDPNTIVFRVWLSPQPLSWASFKITPVAASQTPSLHLFEVITVPFSFLGSTSVATSIVGIRRKRKADSNDDAKD
ncbi:hypothetical protein TNCV_202471 [Trichonephila clavipes]|nr:hypothetical protein TNCV_202471 [Trichonephila clavipes]